MKERSYLIESKKPFAESLIWQINRDYYTKEGIKAWQDGEVPHHLTSNSMVGKTYAQLIFAFLKDLAAKNQLTETVYILELGAGHGRLAFHTVKHLEKLIKQENKTLPPYCYVISDIIEKNISFFEEHPQFQTYFKKGILDIAYFDAIESKELHLRNADLTIQPNDLKQPLLAIANYFFDSIPMDLFHIEHGKISDCWMSIESNYETEEMNEETLLKNLNLVFHNEPVKEEHYKEPVMNELLAIYEKELSNTYLFFPYNGLKCLSNLEELSKQGLCLISMDKGYHELHDLDNRKEPEMITHGSFSFWVNYHALETYCKKQGGTTFFPKYSNFHLELGCLLFVEDGKEYKETALAYERFVNDFGPDDFNTFKQITYTNISRLSLQQLIGVLRLSSYDSTLFKNVLPRLKQVSDRVSNNDRTRLAQTMHQVWNMYFSLSEPMDLAFEIGGVFYQMGYYKEALGYFQHSIQEKGQTADVFYNRALCYYQLREDVQFAEVLAAGKMAFPDFKQFQHLEALDLAVK